MSLSETSDDGPEDIIQRTTGVVVPVCPKFQAIVPEWTGPCKEANDPNSNSLQLLGKRIWPTNGNDSDADGTPKIGEGRSGSCECSRPGSYNCKKRHISEEKARLRNELGEAAYEEWKFDEMGEDVSKSWTSQQQKKFESFVRKNSRLPENSRLQGEEFLKSASELFEGTKSRQDIVSYYLNVHKPKRIGALTRSGDKIENSDDETSTLPRNVKTPSKRSQPQDSDASKCSKPRYLAGHR